MSADARATLDADMSERDFQVQVLALAKAEGWMAYHTADSRRSNPGFPDLVLLRGPQLIFLELKSEKGKATSAQVSWIRRLDAAKLVAANVARPSDWPDIERALTRRQGDAPARHAARGHGEAGGTMSDARPCSCCGESGAYSTGRCLPCLTHCTSGRPCSLSVVHIHRCPSCGVTFPCRVEHRKGTVLLRRQLAELHRRQGHGASAARSATEGA